MDDDASSELPDFNDSESVSMSVTWNDDVAYDEGMDEDEEQEMLKRFREQRENEQFPDEIDTPLDVPARTRFLKYRGLKSFRTSTWDPKENLPLDYARIFQFEDFKHTKKRVLNSEREGALHGWYVTIHVMDVPAELLTFVSEKGPSHPLVLIGLLEHEQRMSVAHYAVTKHRLCTAPVKSKDRLLFQVGYRRFWSNPVFSQHTNGNKHKFERYLPSDAAAVASVYAPIMYPPAPVLVFRESSTGIELVASGCVLSVNPDRIVAKRILLSGHPSKINKRSVVVRYMFFNEDDIAWFKPVELHTKYGRRGHIKDSIGTHGHMKCVFDGPVNQQDTVMMSLYKRVFPKWTYDPTTELR